MNIQNMPRNSSAPPDKCEHCTHRFGDGAYTIEDYLATEYRCAKCGKVTKTYVYDIRRSFIPRPGQVFVCADWDQMEIVVSAALSGDPNLLHLLEERLRDPDNPEFDIHRATAATLYGCTPDQVTPKQRQGIKSVNFGALYGIGPEALRVDLTKKGIYWDLDQTKDALQAVFTTFPGWASMARRQKNTLMKQQYIVNPAGRIRHIMKNSDSNDILSGVNFMNQGWCASIMKQCSNEIHDRIGKEDLDAREVWWIHDEIIVEGKITDAPAVAEILGDVMNMDIQDRARVRLTATPEIKFNMSKDARTYTASDFAKKLKVWEQKINTDAIDVTDPKYYKLMGTLIGPRT